MRKGGNMPLGEEDTYIEVAFMYDQELYVERIYTKDIDPNHYGNLWDWWFCAGTEDHNSQLRFELTADKNENGQFTTDSIYINVYANEDAHNPIAVVREISCRKSWINRKAFT